MSVQPFCLSGLNADMNLKLIFSRHCLLPVLQSMHFYSSRTATEDDSQRFLQPLEDLLWKHVLHPARSSYLNTLRTPETRTQDIPSDLMERLMSPLAEMLASNIEQRSGLLASTTLLYRAAAADLRYTMPRQHTHENIWLQKLFCHLAQHTNVFEYCDSDPTQRVLLSRFAEAMLQVVEETEIKLTTATIERIVRPILRINSRLAEADWRVIATCMKLDAIMFVRPSGDGVGSKKAPHHSSNELLLYLLNRINEHGYRPSLTEDRLMSQWPDDCIYGILQSAIVTTLAESFVQLRELPKFLLVWQEELCQHYMKGPKQMISVWEDDKLMCDLVEIIKPALTFDQADGYLRQVRETFGCLIGRSTDLHSGFEKPTALLAAIECLLLGCTGDRLLQQLESRVSEMYQVLLDVLADKSERPKNLDTRCWRILTIISDRWRGCCNYPDSEKAALKGALDIIGQACILEVPRHDYSHAFQAFRFMMSLKEKDEIQLLNDSSADSSGKYWNPINSAIEWILDHGQDRVWINPTRYQKRWETSNHTITTRAELCLACCSLLVTIPNTFW